MTHRAWLGARIAVLLMFLGGLAPGAQGPSGVFMAAGLASHLASGGSVAVVVGIRAAFRPEGDLAADALADQRSAIARAVQGAATGAVAAGIEVGRRFEHIPFFTARIDAPDLAVLLALPGVTSIEEDAPERALLADSVPLIGAPAAWAAGSPVPGSTWWSAATWSPRRGWWMRRRSPVLARSARPLLRVET